MIDKCVVLYLVALFVVVAVGGGGGLLRCTSVGVPVFSLLVLHNVI